MKQRLDVLLRKWGLAPSRTKAQELLREGAVEVKISGRWEICHEESLPLEETDLNCVRLRSTEVLDYVSRGGRKLANAMDRLHLSVEGLVALDVGLSTGGFSHSLLQHGIKEVVGLDVGHGQLATELKGDSRLVSFDGVNARHMTLEPRLAPWLERGGFDLVVVDVSFISLELILPEVFKVLKTRGQLLALVKPQFEVTARDHNRRGVVANLKLHDDVREKITLASTRLGLQVLDYFKCSLTGQDGNQEYFLYAKKP